MIHQRGNGKKINHHRHTHAIIMRLNCASAVYGVIVVVVMLGKKKKHGVAQWYI